MAWSKFAFSGLTWSESGLKPDDPICKQQLMKGTEDLGEDDSDLQALEKVLDQRHSSSSSRGLKGYGGKSYVTGKTLSTIDRREC